MSLAEMMLTFYLVNAINYSMKTMLTIDRAGRVVLPKAVRNRFRLTPGTSMNLRVESDAIVLMPQQTTASVIQDGTLLIHQGVATGDLLAAVEASRDLRDHDLHRLQE